ncbi:MAG: hypothetical protein IKU03_03455 [Bacteroidales bacterium]|nr:hypothetical protein [Bacteroidales bacterium]
MRTHLETYPEGRLQDIYKSFYQDRFGPGHLLADTSVAMYYLNRELALDSLWKDEDPFYELTGFQGNYVRVYLSCLNDSLTVQKFCDAFIRSAGLRVKLPLSWADEWHLILQIIEQHGWQMPDYERDKAMIEELLSTGDQPITHSRSYNAHYHPHYRIVTREIFEDEILPMLEH